jgi:hypothetical protein
LLASCVYPLLQHRRSRCVARWNGRDQVGERYWRGSPPGHARPGRQCRDPCCFRAVRLLDGRRRRAETEAGWSWSYPISALTQQSHRMIAAFLEYRLGRSMQSSLLATQHSLDDLSQIFVGWAAGEVPRERSFSDGLPPNRACRFRSTRLSGAFRPRRAFVGDAPRVSRRGSHGRRPGSFDGAQPSSGSRPGPAYRDAVGGLSGGACDGPARGHASHTARRYPLAGVRAPPSEHSKHAAVDHRGLRRSAI